MMTGSAATVAGFPAGWLRGLPRHAQAADAPANPLITLVCGSGVIAHPKPRTYRRLRADVTGIPGKGSGSPGRRSDIDPHPEPAVKRLIPKTGLRSLQHHPPHDPGAPAHLERHETRVSRRSSAVKPRIQCVGQGPIFMINL